MRESHLPYDESTRSGPPVYIVLDSNILIAEDLCGSLQASGVCRVIRVLHPSDLRPVLDQEAHVSAAFLEMRYDQVLEAGVDQALLARGAKIILTTDEDDESKVLKHGWALLVRPFTEDMIRTVLPGQNA
jgi:hypothetical protein